MYLEVLSNKVCSSKISNYKFSFIFDNFLINSKHCIVITYELLLFMFEYIPSDNEGLEDKFILKFDTGSFFNFA